MSLNIQDVINFYVSSNEGEFPEKDVILNLCDDFDFLSARFVSKLMSYQRKSRDSRLTLIVNLLSELTLKVDEAERLCDDFDVEIDVKKRIELLKTLYSFILTEPNSKFVRKKNNVTAVSKVVRGVSGMCNVFVFMLAIVTFCQSPFISPTFVSQPPVFQPAMEIDVNPEEEKKDDEKTMAEHVYDYFYPRAPSNMRDLLKHSGFHLESLFSGGSFPLIEEKEKITIITSDAQNQKTFLLIMVMLIYLAAGESIVFIISNSDDCPQFRNRIEPVMADVKEYLKTKGFTSQDELARFDKTLFFDSKNKMGSYEKKEIQTAFKSGTKNPRILCCTHVAKQLNNNVMDLMQSGFKFILMIDEAHKLNGIKHSWQEDGYDGENVYQGGIAVIKDKETGEKVKSRVLFDEAVFELRMKSRFIIEMTATPQDSFFGLKNVFERNVVVIPQSESYRGIENFTFEETEDSIDALVFLSGEKPYQRVNSRPNTKEVPNICGRVDIHPVVALFVDRKFTQKHLMRGLVCKIRYPRNDVKFEKIAKGDWVVINYIGSKIFISHSSLDGKEFEINGVWGKIKKKEDDTMGKIHEFNSGTGSCSITIEDVLQYFGQSENGFPKFPRILIIKYQMGTKGISFSSKYSEPENIHVTDMIINLPETQPSADIYQSICRGAGCYGDNISTRVFCPLDNWERAVKERTTLKKFLKFIETNHGNGLTCNDLCKNFAIEENYLPKRFTKFKVQPDFYEIENPNEIREEEILRTGNASEFMTVAECPNIKVSCEKRKRDPENPFVSNKRKKSEEEDEIDSEFGETDDDETENHYLKRPIILTDADRKNYNLIRDRIHELSQCNKWIKKFQLWQNETAEQKTFLANITWHLHNNANVEDVDDETLPGLLFKQEGLGKRWDVRFNT